MTSISLAEVVSPERSLEDLEDEIATLSALIQAATYRLLCLVEEFDRRSGWADPLDSNGFRSPAHWLCWRVGLSLGTARQYVRVARALPALPRISAAFEAGEVSYSKVRAITRIAEPANEELLLEWARAGTASHVEKLVRGFRRADVALENERAREQQTSRYLQTHYDNEGMLVVRARLPPEQGALLLKALEVARDELLREENGGELAPSSVDGSAESRANTSAAANGGKVMTTAMDGSAESSVADAPNGRMTGGQLMADGLVRVAERALAERTARAGAADRFQVVIHVDAEVLADPEADGRCYLEDGPTIATETARRLACDATLCELRHGLGDELTAGRKTRVISPALRRALKARDGTRCAFPGCTCQGRDAHHVKHWAEHGPTVLTNLLSLCRAHHTLVHEGGWRVEPRSDGTFRFVRPDGRELVPSPSLPPVTGPVVESLTTRWVPPEVRITPSTGRPTWQGESVDYDWAVETLWMVREMGSPVEPAEPAEP